MEGLLASLNYAGSFLAIHFAHFTLATKQPAMTGPALAHRLDGAGAARGARGVRRRHHRDDPLERGGNFGNLAVVFPVALLVQWLAAKLLGASLITPAKAIATIESFSILGPTPLYAAFTGVLLAAVEPDRRLGGQLVRRRTRARCDGLPPPAALRAGAGRGDEASADFEAQRVRHCGQCRRIPARARAGDPELFGRIWKCAM